MRKLTKLLLGGALGSILLLGTSLTAKAYPTGSELNNSYNFSATLTQSENTQFQEKFDALKSNFTFVIDYASMYDQGVTGFILPTKLTIYYTESTGQISLNTKFGRILDNVSGTAGMVYFSETQWGTDGATDGKSFTWQVSADGSTITIPDFYVKDYDTDLVIATYSSISVTVATGGGGDEDDDDQDLPTGPGPAVSTIYGNYTFTADAVYETKYSWVEESLDSKEFSLSAYGQFVSLDNFLKSGSVDLTYNQSAATLTNTRPGFIGFMSDPDFTLFSNIEIGSASGGKVTSVVWYVDEDGTIIIPKFTLIDTNNSNALVATFTNCKVTKVVEEEEEYDFPPLSDLAKTYQWGGSANVGQESLYTEYIQQYANNGSFTLGTTVTENQVSIENFLGSTTFNGTYDRNEGTITFTSLYLTYVNDHQTWRDEDDIEEDNYPKNVTFGLTDATVDAFTTGLTWVWQVSEEGEITIPSFKVWNSNPYNGLEKAPIVTFTNINMDGGLQETLPDGVVNPEIGEYEIVGTYDWAITPVTDFSGTTSSPVTIEVEVREPNNSDGSTYYLAETGNTNYFNGNIIQASYANGNLTIQQRYAGRFEGQTVWFTPWTYNGSITEPMSSGIMIGFSTTDGFSFKEDLADGFGWFVSPQSEFEPEDFYSSFYLPTATQEEEPEVTISNADAEVEDGVVTVTFEAEILNLAIEDIAEMKAEFTSDTAEAITVDVTESNDVYQAVIEDLEAGDYTYSFTLVLYNENGDVITSSNPLDIKFTIEEGEQEEDGPTIDIEQENAEIEGSTDAEGNIVITFSAQIDGIDVDDILWTGVISYKDESGQTLSYEVTPVYDETEGTFTITVPAGAIELEGASDFTLTITALDAAGEVIATSNPAKINLDTTAINSLNRYEEEGVVYYNLSGMRVNNPSKGLYIKVKDGKSSKVLVK